MTGTGRFPHLFRPMRLGPITLANRIVFGAHPTGYAEDGLPTERHAAYYAARARGGAGLIIAEEQSVHPSDRPRERTIRGFDPAVVARHRKVTEAVHREGVPILAQINHNGGQSTSLYSRRPLWAPSPVADPAFREVPKALERQEISEIIDGYGLVAGHCVEGGFDGVELQCAHSSIVRAFLSPATNRRGDRYGGSPANRTRLLSEIISEVRRRIGPDLVLGVRLCCDELVDGGTTLEDAIAVARVLEASGKVDYVGASIGVSTAAPHLDGASMHIPPGYALFVANALRRAVDLPVIGAGRFKDPVQADRALADGHCDLVDVVRGQIADPDFAAKARAGAPEAVRVCLSCNQDCVGRVRANRRLGCVENPRVGREFLPALSSRRAGRDVLVAGAGPAGLQTALAAARAGHRVRVYEAERAAGGQVLLAASTPGRAEFGVLVRNQLTECRRLGVRVEYGRPVDAELVRREAPEVLVVATGARPRRPAWGRGRERVVDVRDVLSGRVRPSGSVLLVDEVGFHQATGTAELLADRGCVVEVVTSAMVVGQDLATTLDLENWCVRATAKGIGETCDHEVVRVGECARTGRLEVELAYLPTGETSGRTVDWVVCALPQAPLDGLYRALRRHPSVQTLRVGDCVAPRRVDMAVIEGERIGTSL
ncbi:mycofactocin system FadH/OYE family oxidoreductase 2 [Marinactinospora thermotolerans]|uniref:2,4-dienoyl-CoA reductase (NADPH2) n=1 Tax=Marinactinospora thermotolerans DSM 45154 TaxID=1122192 RepID=A0A1T4RQR6_9ACTN|nr:mycofactocin system FadH/OYE family oxidoreductase 2 [Marinactinospora thermotolerans]SKA17981.1 2,4-dienoyl-CoA reductase (NADPH2) [Marinactinospora thermotolerans DSM 45154]